MPGRREDLKKKKKMETETSDRTTTRRRKERGKVVTVAREGRPPSATPKKNKSGSSYIRRKLSCFNPTATDDDQPSARDVDESPTPGEKDSLRRVPVHLVIMVNGIIGSAANWSYAAKQFVKKLPEDVIVHCSECNSNTLTFDGVDIMGQRLAKEVSCITESRPKLQKISFVAHSLGGLVARYAIALLYRQNLQREPSEENGDSDNHGSGTLCLEENSKGRIAGLEPMNFITFATPHLGSRWHKQVPILCGFQVLEKMATRTSWIFGRTGKHLVLRDHDDEKPPLLVQMVNDCENLQFMSALQSFRRRVAYSNVCFDHIVGWKTSSIRHQHELPKPHTFVKNTKYPHIVHVETPKTTSVQQEFLTEAKVKTVDIEVLLDIMLRGLNKVTWERVDVSFQKSKQRYFAHSTIQVKTYCINSDGADVILHLIDNFLL